MLNYLEQNPEVFYGVFFLIILYNVIIFYRGSRKAEAIFPEIKTQNVKYRDKNASGYSTKTLLTKLGGASKVLDVIVTDHELWIKGNHPIFSFIGSKHDLMHRIPLSNITNISVTNGKANISFANSTGSTTSLVLRVKNSQKFVEAIND